MNYDDYKLESPDAPDYFCMICDVEITSGRVCGNKDCIDEYKGYEYLKSKI